MENNAELSPPASKMRRMFPKSRVKRWGCFTAILVSLVFFSGLVLPENLMIPVRGADTADWNHQTFWHYPWGKSVVHKGIDIFSRRGSEVLSATGGWVLSAKTLPRGGNIVLILGPKWHLHYYAHLDTMTVNAGRWVARGTLIGTVGTTGNARGTPAHLHYSIVTLMPYPWRIDSSPQGWKKMFFLDPSKKLRKQH